MPEVLCIYSLFSLLQTLIYKWETRCQTSYFLTEERIFTSLTSNTLPRSRGQWFSSLITEKEQIHPLARWKPWTQRRRGSQGCTDLPWKAGSPPGARHRWSWACTGSPWWCRSGTLWGCSTPCGTPGSWSGKLLSGAGFSVLHFPLASSALGKGRKWVFSDISPAQSPWCCTNSAGQTEWIEKVN